MSGLAGLQNCGVGRGRGEGALQNLGVGSVPVIYCVWGVTGDRQGLDILCSFR